jgi:hypothetical protein
MQYAWENYINESNKFIIAAPEIVIGQSKHTFYPEALRIITTNLYDSLLHQISN